MSEEEIGRAAMERAWERDKSLADAYDWPMGRNAYRQLEDAYTKGFMAGYEAREAATETNQRIVAVLGYEAGQREAEAEAEVAALTAQVETLEHQRALHQVMMDEQRRVLLMTGQERAALTAQVAALEAERAGLREAVKELIAAQKHKDDAVSAHMLAVRNGEGIGEAATAAARAVMALMAVQDRALALATVPARGVKG